MSDLFPPGSPLNKLPKAKGDDTNETKPRINIKERNFENEVELEPTPETKQPQFIIKEERFNAKITKPVSFWKKAFSRILFVASLFGIWMFGQGSLGIPDELLIQIITFYLYKSYEDNGYQVPARIKNLFKK